MWHKWIPNEEIKAVSREGGFLIKVYVLRVQRIKNNHISRVGYSHSARLQLHAEVHLTLVNSSWLLQLYFCVLTFCISYSFIVFLILSRLSYIKTFFFLLVDKDAVSTVRISFTATLVLTHQSTTQPSPACTCVRQ